MERKEVPYAWGARGREFVGPLANYAAQKCRGSASEYEHNSARYTRTDLSRLAPRAVSLMAHGVRAVWAVWPMRGQEALCSNFVPNKTNSLKGAARLGSGHLCGENLSPNFT